MKIIGIDYGSGDTTAASYRCNGCGRFHTFPHRPLRLPLVFDCECGNQITIDDPIIRALPKPDDQLQGRR